jgi:hypothetical protein
MNWLDLGPTFIRRVLITTLWVGAVAFLCIGVYVGLRSGISWAIGVALGMADLALLDALLKEAIHRRRTKSLVLFGTLKFGAIYAAGALLLLEAGLSPWPLLAGFSLFLAIALLKVLGRLVLSSTPLMREREGPGGPFLRQAPGTIQAHAPGGHKDDRR